MITSSFLTRWVTYVKIKKSKWWERIKLNLNQKNERPQMTHYIIIKHNYRNIMIVINIINPQWQLNLYYLSNHWRSENGIVLLITV